jgi:hypothetical protein
MTPEYGRWPASGVRRLLIGAGVLVAIVAVGLALAGMIRVRCFPINVINTQLGVVGLLGAPLRWLQ